MTKKELKQLDILYGDAVLAREFAAMTRDKSSGVAYEDATRCWAATNRVILRLQHLIPPTKVE